MTYYVLGFCFCKDEVLLTKRPEWQNGKLNGVGGKMKTGETTVEAMVREFREETGFEVQNWKYCLVLRTNKSHITIFSARVGVRFESVEQCEWFKVLPENVIPNLRWIVPMLLDNSVKLPLSINYM